jgi:hypothetical protein
MPCIDVAIRYDYASLTGFMNGLVPQYVIGHAIMRWQ